MDWLGRRLGTRRPVRGAGGRPVAASTPLDFSAGTMTRASEAAFEDPRGGWEFAASGAAAWLGSNVARIFSDNAILIEGARTNTIKDNRDITNATDWALTGWTGYVATDDYAAGPDGISSAARLEVPASSFSRGQASGHSNGTTVAVTWWAKQNAGASKQDVNYAGAYNLVDVAADWSRHEFSTTVAANTNLYPDDTFGAGANGPHDILNDLWTVEAGAFPSSTIRTTSGAGATRAAELFSVPSSTDDFRLGSWQVVVTPSYATAVAPSTAYVFYIDASNYLALVSGNTVRCRANGTNYDVTGLSWSAYDNLTLDVDFAGDSLTVTGGGGGSQTLSGDWPASSATVYVGSDSSTANHLWGVTTQPVLT